MMSKHNEMFNLILPLRRVWDEIDTSLHAAAAAPLSYEGHSHFKVALETMRQRTTELLALAREIGLEQPETVHLRSQCRRSSDLADEMASLSGDAPEVSL